MLTLAQRKTLSFLETFIEKNEYAPTSAEIAVGIGIKSRGVVHRYLKALQNAGVIDLLPGRHRNIVLKEKAQKPKVEGMPIVGCMSEGQPIKIDEINGMVDIETTMMKENRFALRVSGNTMVKEGILDGDIIVCQYADKAKNGQAVVALLDGKQAILRRIIKHDDGYVTLLGVTAQYQPQRFAANRVYVQGVLVGLLRLQQFD